MFRASSLWHPKALQKPSSKPAGEPKGVGVSPRVLEGVLFTIQEALKRPNGASEEPPRRRRESTISSCHMVVGKTVVSPHLSGYSPRGPQDRPKKAQEGRRTRAPSWSKRPPKRALEAPKRARKGIRADMSSPFTEI
eukprot:6084538-Pyramimonas_sp.AAC.1